MDSAKLSELLGQLKGIVGELEAAVGGEGAPSPKGEEAPEGAEVEATAGAGGAEDKESQKAMIAAALKKGG